MPSGKAPILRIDRRVPCQLQRTSLASALDRSRNCRRASMCATAPVRNWPLSILKIRRADVPASKPLDEGRGASQ